MQDTSRNSKGLVENDQYQMALRRYRKMVRSLKDMYGSFFKEFIPFRRLRFADIRLINEKAGRDENDVILLVSEIADYPRRLSLLKRKVKSAKSEALV